VCCVQIARDLAPKSALVAALDAGTLPTIDTVFEPEAASLGIAEATVQVQIEVQTELKLKVDPGVNDKSEAPAEAGALLQPATERMEDESAAQNHIHLDAQDSEMEDARAVSEQKSNIDEEAAKLAAEREATRLQHHQASEDERMRQIVDRANKIAEEDANSESQCQMLRSKHAQDAEAERARALAELRSRDTEEATKLAAEREAIRLQHLQASEDERVRQVADHKAASAHERASLEAERHRLRRQHAQLAEAEQAERIHRLSKTIRIPPGLLQALQKSSLEQETDQLIDFEQTLPDKRTCVQVESQLAAENLASAQQLEEMQHHAVVGACAYASHQSQQIVSVDAVTNLVR
jgi:hypothetical protein